MAEGNQATNQDSPNKKSWQNWGRNQTMTPHQIVRPVSEEQAADLVKQCAAANLRVKPVGSGHSFTGIALTDDVMFDMSGLAGIEKVDIANNQVTVWAGTVLHDLNLALWNEGLSLSNLGDIDAQTVAGSIATGTHGTGVNYQTIAAGVVGLRLIAGDGTLMEMSETKRPELLNAARVSLGALGLITSVTLQCEPAFKLRAVEETLEIDEVLDTFTEISATNEHTEFYWFPHTNTGLRKVNNRTLDDISTRSKLKTFVAEELNENLSFEMLNRMAKVRPRVVPKLINKAIKPGAKAQFVAPSHEVFCSSRRVRFVEMEYNIARTNLLEAFDRVRLLLNEFEEQDRYISFPIEVRTLGADNIPLSPASGRESGYIAVHVYRGNDHTDYFGKVEAIMADYNGRPHWGKMHTQTAKTLEPLYPKWEQFAAARDELDPQRRFANDYLDRVLGP